jgi:DNA-binding ferritin-like protein
MEELATHAENVLGLFTGSRSRRRVSSSLTKRRLTSKAKADVEESQEAIEAFKLELEELEDQLRDELDELDDRWDAAAQQVEQTVVKPYKKDILADLFGVAWFPYWRFQVGGKAIELAAYASQET